MLSDERRAGGSDILVSATVSDFVGPWFKALAVPKDVNLNGGNNRGRLIAKCLVI